MIGLTGSGELDALAVGVCYTHGAGVVGDVAEFGCFFGRSARVLAAMIAQEAKPTDAAQGIALRHLWLFDSFQGMPEAQSPIDTQSPFVQAGVWNWTIGDDTVLAPTPATISAMCGAHIPLERIHVVPGWYKDTLASIPPKTRFALVHVDCDLYESTYQVLTHLFSNELLSDGCALYFDDWYCNRGNPRWGEQAAFRDTHPTVVIHGYNVTDWGAYGIVGRRFIVHRAA